ncbi:pentatricopeptide repeat-containing protein [Perkinsela sp. CCAP 1560/4]|nr:pentatricopeptide repeat-containing protein [Perkinsela sp. CCAP 1560/4]|eukprot:KNH05466.1 pentatricopeptide repeat-containing protein [Perkinsela sp. CCAP 1560/4]
MKHPKRRPQEWHEAEFHRRGHLTWPKEIGFWNQGDNWELTPEFSWRFYLHNRDKMLWTQEKNEETVVSQMPMVEVDPKKYIPRVEEIFEHHIKRFGRDHIIYNAVMQAKGFAGDFDGAKIVFEEMKKHELSPNAQSYFNMMFAARSARKPIEIVRAYWDEAVQTQCIRPTLRADFEFKMWMDQLDRMGSFTTTGFLSNNEEGASMIPSNMWATRGWDERSEPKHPTRARHLKEEAARRGAPGKLLRSSFAQYERRPWHQYKGMYPWDYRGPSRRSQEKVGARVDALFPDPDPEVEVVPYERCGKAIPL